MAVADELLTLSQAARTLPHRPNASTVWRWCREGIKARDGQRIRLRVARIGGRILTTEVWLREFGEAIAAADAQHFSDEPRAESPEHAAAVAELRRRGLMD